jgi:hypothetical protein
MVRRSDILWTIVIALGLAIPLTFFAAAASLSLFHSSNGLFVALLIVPGFLATMQFHLEAHGMVFWSVFLSVQAVYYLIVASVLRCLYTRLRGR